MIGVMVAADDRTIGISLVRMLRSLQGIDLRAVVTECRVLKHVDIVRPEVVVLAPVRADDEALGTATSLCRRARVILLAPSCERPAVADAVRAGASGYLPAESLGCTELDLAVRGVAQGATVISGASAAMFADELRNGYLPAPPIHHALTRQEQALMQCLVRGWSNAAIGENLYLAPKTVRNYLSRIYTKLGVCGRAEAIATWLGVADERSAAAGAAGSPVGARPAHEARR